MADNFNKQWKKARAAMDEAESVRALAKILSSKDGRTFILDLEPPEAELCIEILDYVSSNPPSRIHGDHSPTQSGPGGAQGSRI